MTKKPANRKEFFADGLRFECTACGECCSNHNGYDFVYLTRQDIVEMAKRLKLPRKTFLETYTRLDDGDVVLKDRGEACIFLKGGGKCAVYASRPLQCRTFPFWAENMNRKTWETEIRRDCPGTNEDRLVPAATIREQLAWERKERYPKAVSGKGKRRRRPAKPARARAAAK